MADKDFQTISRGMTFRFQGNYYITNMIASELYGDGVVGSPGYNIPIKLSDGRFIKVKQWRLSRLPQPGSFVVINGEGIDKYAIAKPM